MKKVTLVLMSLMLWQSSFAQTEDKPWAVGLYGGKSEYNGDLGNGFFNFGKAWYGFGGLSVSRYLNKSFDLTLYGSYGEHGIFENPYSRFRARNAYFDLTAKYKFIKNEYAGLVPYVFAGVGTRFLSAPSSSFAVSTGNTPDFVLPLGAGVDYRITESIALRYFGTFGWTNHDYHDYQTNTKQHDYQLQHNLGIVFSFGKKKDDDKDGVSNKKDKCHETPSQAKVDKDGCPLDSDGDGIPDYLDACPNVKGVASASGCPDRDGDGVADDKDECPDVKGLAELNGCPDKDGDGIPDHKDECPDVKGIAKFNGCPDTDGDGIPDKDDACPKVAGEARYKGCPDTDGDGIPDNLDKCPKLPGTAANEGCPEVSVKDKQVLEKAMKGIQFETGKDVIKPSSYSILNNVVSVLNANPEWVVEVQGHTASTGDYAKNKTLSQNRADAVKKYLENKGVKNKMTAVGYGPDQPKGDNNTAAGRAENRRVEFKITYQE